MVPIKTRLIREHNRLYKFWMRLLWRLGGLESPIVLMVHGFKPSPKTAFELTAGSFEYMLRHLCDKGWHAMTEEELLSGAWTKKSFYLTFDDVYDTVYTEAYPLLKLLQIPFTVFITKDLIDKPGYITGDHLKELAGDPLCSIGAHGLQHCVFRNLSGDEALHQFEISKQWLEEEMGGTVNTFAFPYGRVVEVSSHNRRQVRNAGYEMVFSAIEGTLHSSWFTGKFFLPRVNVSERFVEKFSSGKFPSYKDCEGR